MFKTICHIVLPILLILSLPLSLVCIVVSVQNQEISQVGYETLYDLKQKDPRFNKIISNKMKDNKITNREFNEIQQEYLEHSLKEAKEKLQ